MTASVTEKVAEWVVNAKYEDIPSPGPERVRERFLDSLGVQFGGMSTSTGQILAKWIKAQETKAECSIVGGDFKTTASYAALLNAASGHAQEFDDIAAFSGHYANPLTAAVLAVGEKLGSSGRDAILAWMVGYEVITQTSRLCLGPKGHELLNRGWFNQGFQPALGVAALTAKLMKFDVMQTRMAIGHAASTMAGIMKNRGSDTKSFAAGNAAMHGVMAGELVALGFTANAEIIDGDLGVARLVSFEKADASRVLDGLGSWELVKNSSTLRLNASCAAGHFSQEAMLNIVKKRPFKAEEVEAIDIHVNDFLLPNVPYDNPQTGLEGKYSLEYDVAVIVLDGKSGIKEFTDAKVQRPEARALMKRMVRIPVVGDLGKVMLGSTVVVKLKNGEVLEGVGSKVHGMPVDPLTRQEVTDKFHECAEPLIPLTQRNRVIELCDRLEKVENLREIARAVSIAS
jgi:2-methylcitrate dehydratase PrpD